MLIEKKGIHAVVAAAVLLLASTSGTLADDPPASATTPSAAAGGDIPADFKVIEDGDDYIKRDVMIPMRDGVKLYTVIVVPKGAAHAPIILDRTPYSADKFARNNDSPHRTMILPNSFGELSEAGYII